MIWIITSPVGATTGAAPCWQCAPQPDTVNERTDKTIATDYGDDRANFNKGTDSVSDFFINDLFEKKERAGFVKLGTLFSYGMQRLDVRSQAFFAK